MKPNNQLDTMNQPQAGHDPPDDGVDEVAQERRRQERLRRKQQKRRENHSNQVDEEHDPDVLLETAKRPKRKKHKKPRPELWSDENIEDEPEEDTNGRRRKSRRNRGDWDDEWNV